MASAIEDGLSQAGNFFSGLWGEATDYLTAREERKAAEARQSMAGGGSVSGATGAGNWTNPDAVAAAMGTGSGKHQNLMLFLAFAGVAISLLAFIRRS